MYGFILKIYKPHCEMHDPEIMVYSFKDIGPACLSYYIDAPS